MEKIQFVFEGVHLEVDASEYPFTHLRLPNLTVVAVTHWEKTNPPTPHKLEYTDALFEDGYEPPMARLVDMKSLGL